MTAPADDEPFEGAFAMLDVLGFRRRIESMPIREVRDRVVHSVVSSVEAAESVVMRDRLRPQSPWRTPLRWAYFADTVVLWLPNRDGDAAITLSSMVYACQIIVACAMWLDVPLRGALAFGECIVSDDPIYYLGKPILEAHDLEKRQDWAGVAVCQSALDRTFSEESGITRWLVPMKGASDRVETPVIDWPAAMHSTPEAPEPNWHACFPGDEEDVRRKREATAAFCRHRLRERRATRAMFGPDWRGGRTR